jgi:putative protein kinase ArgK-like GTPase of G3E family
MGAAALSSRLTNHGQSAIGRIAGPERGGDAGAGNASLRRVDAVSAGPRVIIFTGRPGTGKSTLAERMARTVLSRRWHDQRVSSARMTWTRFSACTRFS